MNTEKKMKESRMIMLVTLIIGIVILFIGIILSLMKIDLVPNNKAIIGLSIIPLSLAFVYYVKLSRIKKSSQQMRNIIINENDSRIAALKIEADAKALKVTQAALFITYMGYTLIFPEDIFESIGWWILMFVLFVSFMSQGILLSHGIISSENASKDDGK